MKLVERISRVCKAFIRQNMAALKNKKVKLIVVYLQFFSYMLFHSFDSFSINVENNRNKTKTPNQEKGRDLLKVHCEILKVTHDE